MKKFAVLFVALAFAATAYGAPFNDVPRTHWAYDAIQKAVNAGILQGYDGKFHGKRLLNRYQMAVITAKLLDKMGEAGPSTMGGSEDLKKMISNLEALTIEFADELALLNVKVSTLEDTVAELKMGHHQKPVHHTGPVGGEIGFTAFANFALVFNDEDNGGNRYGVTGNGTDSTFFDVPRVSLGVDKEVNPGVYFHMQADFNSELNGAGNGVAVDEAYFFVDEIFGDVGGKVGGFASPFSMEHNGPFRTLNMSITPSIANTYHEGFRFTGLELQRTKDVMPEDMIWKFGVVSGSDAVAAPAPLNASPAMHDRPANINSLEDDDGFGFYIWVGKKPERSGDWGWNLSYMDNGGDNGAAAPYTASSETDFFQFGFEWANDDFLVMLQYLDGTQDFGGDLDFTTYYLLLNYKIDEEQSVSLRYDDIEWDAGGDANAGGITFAYNRQVTDNSMLQFEYLSPDSDDLADPDVDDDLIQFRYKVHF